jgi:hypothetical protein
VDWLVGRLQARPKPISISKGLLPMAGGGDGIRTHGTG